MACCWKRGRRGKTLTVSHKERPVLMENDEPLRYVIVYCTNKDSSHSTDQIAATDDFRHGRGWTSAESCKYPQRLILKFESKVMLRKIQVLLHDTFVPTKIMFFANEDDNALYTDSPKEIQCRMLGSATFKASKTGLARELKTIFLDAECWFLKLMILQNFANKQNPSNQVGIMGLDCYGEFKKSASKTATTQSTNVTATPWEKSRKVLEVGSARNRISPKSSRLREVEKSSLIGHLEKVRRLVEEEALSAIDISHERKYQRALQRLSVASADAQLLLDQELVAFRQGDNVYAEACEGEIRRICLQAYNDCRLSELLSQQQLHSLDLSEDGKRNSGVPQKDGGQSKRRQQRTDSSAASTSSSGAADTTYVRD